MKSDPLLLFDSVGERYGALLRTRSVGGITLRESRYPARTIFPRIAHHEAYFCLVIAGSMCETTRGRKTLYGPGTIHFHAAGVPHEVRAGSTGFHVLSLVPQRADLPRLEAALSRAGDVPLPPPMSDFGALLSREFHSREGDSDPALESLARQLLSAALGIPAGPRRPEPRWLADVLELLSAQASSTLTVSALAHSAGLHPVHFVRAFRTHVGCTPGAYLRRLRVEASRRVLEETRAPLAHVALESGFASQAHFTSVFGSQMGLPPGAYRRLAHAQHTLKS